MAQCPGYPKILLLTAAVAGIYASSMDGSWLARWRWRTRGAWLWPTFVLITVADGAIVHSRPLAGDSQTLVGGIVFAVVANLIAVVVLSWPLGMLVRRLRADMPTSVARNYGGTFAVLIVTGGLVAIGLAHHGTIVSQQRTLNDGSRERSPTSEPGRRLPSEPTCAIRTRTRFSPGSTACACPIAPPPAPTA